MLIIYPKCQYNVSKNLVNKCELLKTLFSYYDQVELTEYEDVLVRIICNDINLSGDVERLHLGLVYFGYDYTELYKIIILKERKKIISSIRNLIFSFGSFEELYFRINFSSEIITEKLITKNKNIIIKDSNKFNIIRLFNNPKISTNWLMNNYWFLNCVNSAYNYLTHLNFYSYIEDIKSNRKLDYNLVKLIKFTEFTEPNVLITSI